MSDLSLREVHKVYRSRGAKDVPAVRGFSLDVAGGEPGGTEVVLGVRPESLWLVPQDAPEALLSGRVVVTEDVLEFSVITIELPGGSTIWCKPRRGTQPARANPWGWRLHPTASTFSARQESEFDDTCSRGR